MKIVKCLPEFEYFTVFLKNRNFISKIRISKVTDYAALISIYKQLFAYCLGVVQLFHLLRKGNNLVKSSYAF